MNTINPEYVKATTAFVSQDSVSNSSRPPVEPGIKTVNEKPENKWPKHPWYKRILDHKLKISLMPLLMLFAPESNPDQKLPLVPIVR